MKLDDEHNLIATAIEANAIAWLDRRLYATGQPKAAAKALGFGIFRAASPSLERMEALLNDLALIGIRVKLNGDIPRMIQSIPALLIHLISGMKSIN